MPKINLLFVITKLELGGAQKQLLLLISRLDKAKYNIFLLTARGGLLINEASSIKGVRVNTLWALERVVSPFKDLFALIAVYNFIKKNKIDIVHTHSSKAGIIGRWAGRLGKAKVIHTVHGWSFNDYQSWLFRKIFIGLEKVTAAITDKLIVVSNHDKDLGISKRIAGEKKYTLIRYAINFEEFRPKAGENDKIRRELGIDNQQPIIGMIACFKAQKAPLDYIRVAAMVSKVFRQAKFILVGDGVLRSRIERLIGKFGLKDKIILTGWRRDIPEILSTIDVFVLTSLWEGLPIVVLEAMAAQKPVVVTNTGAVAEVIRDGFNGFLTPREDAEVMKKDILTLLKDEQLRSQAGKRAADSLDFRFSVDNLLKQTQDLYDNLINLN